MLKIIVNVILFCLISTIAYGEDLQSFAGKSTMNGYALDEFKNFDQTWKLITVRYRKDTGEMRFTYANKLAEEYLKKKSKDYPDGAIFGKIGFITGQDPDFTSSEVPSGARRFQFMIRDKKKFSDTDGWGYVLFDTEGKTFPENPIDKSQACAACHRLVNHKGQVFSEQIVTATDKWWIPTAGDQHGKLEFETVELSILPNEIKKFFPPKTKKIRSLKGELQEKLFQGTLDEIRPTLIKEAVAHQMPAALIQKNKLRFSIAYVDQSFGKCGDKQIPIHWIMSLLGASASKDIKTVFKKICHDL